MAATGVMLRLPIRMAAEEVVVRAANGSGGENNSSGSSSADDASGTSGSGVMTGQLIPLPVKFVSFTAVKDGGQDVLNWQVGDAVDGLVFTVQRSADGQQFSAIGDVSGV